MEIFIIWLLLAGGVGYLAHTRGRSGFGYFLLAVGLSPLIGLIVVLVSDDMTKKAELAKSEEKDHQRRIEEVRVLATSRGGATPQPLVQGVAGSDALLASLKAEERL